ncbi:nitrate ABC transporter substrate-binding protein [Fulvimarina endophytica]|uniref:Nitrate ABC transporter substrate-binding protein n=1 Tax=Fulvimarina endophytica TaxID=2293836 RepID=A0A371WY82_9HYPH|nr:ABC transporter substrate-binding protein [Fulvimarina endophytica]RFC61960.1 nitrate ABC transporter substrate-binding protein [Fulvimarina endophytica]
MALDIVHAGYLPLLDSAVLVTAARLGFARSHGVDLVLHRERSWAAIRDRMSVGHFDCAQMPAPLPIAMSLSVGPLGGEVFAPLVLNTGGNAITLSRDLGAEVIARAPASLDDPRRTGPALQAALAGLAAARGRPARFAVVHRFSCHNYDLRDWLAASGMVPDEDVEITVLPPSMMPDHLSSGQIDGFSAGDPWNTIAVRSGGGVIAATKAELSPGSPEKVLGVSPGFLAERPEVLERTIRCLLDAGAWCGEEGNHAELAELLSRKEHVGVDPADLAPGLSGRIEIGGGRTRHVADFLAFAAPGMNPPDPGHAAWLHRQMVRWGHAAGGPEEEAVARGVFRPDLHARAIGGDPHGAGSVPLGQSAEAPRSDRGAGS